MEVNLNYVMKNKIKNEQLKYYKLIFLFISLLLNGKIIFENK